MIVIRAAAFKIALVMGNVSALAQTSTRQATPLLDSIPNMALVADAGAATELMIRWNVAESVGDDPIPAADVRPLNQFQVVSRRSVTPALVRERSPQLSPERLIVVAVDASGREVAWQQLQDPRIVRAETPGPTLELSGQILYRPVTELLITIPDALGSVAVRIYQVRPNGADWLLESLGEIAIAAR